MRKLAYAVSLIVLLTLGAPPTQAWAHGGGGWGHGGGWHGGGWGHGWGWGRGWGSGGGRGWCYWHPYRCGGW